MTYVLDLKRLWTDRPSISESQRKAAARVHLDPRQKLVSVIVVIQNDDLHFMQTLHCVVAQLMVRELIVVNMTQDSTIEESLAQFSYQYPRTILVTGENVKGLAAAYNLGAQYASTPYLLFLDAHSLLPKDALLQLLATGIRKTGAWVIGASIAHPKPYNELSAPFFRKYFSTLTKQSVPEVSLAGGGHYAQVVPGECLLLPTRVFAELRGFDKCCYHTTFHWDFCLRVHQSGGSVFQAKEVSLGLTDPLITTFKGLFRQEWQSFQGWCYFYRKNFSKLTNIFSMLTFHLGLTFASAVSICRKVFALLTKRESMEKDKMAWSSNRGT